MLIADDEPLARERLRQLLSAEPDTEIIGECADGRETVAAIRSASPDLVFLDVQMPELDGFGVLRALGEERLPAVIFVTAYDRYAVRAFETCAVDYLLKPFDRERLRRALHRGRARARESPSTRRMTTLLNTLPARPPYLERLIVKSVGRVTILKIEDLDWIQAADNYAELHVGKAVHLLRQTMTGLEQQLPPHLFARISRSLLVNLHRIVELRSTPHGGALVQLRDGTQLNASRNHRRELERRLGKAD